MLKVGLPKGNVKSKSINLVRNILAEEYNENLLHFCKDNIEIFLLKQRDIPELLNAGILDVGITSTEWITEKAVDLTIDYYTDWCDTRISLITPKEHDGEVLKTCVTEYPRIAHQFFTEHGMDVEIITLSGSSEALVPYVYDCCIDCVETGETLRYNALVENSVILEAQTVLVHKKLSAEAECFIENLKTYFTSHEK